MASKVAKRVSVSSVDWARFAAVVPKEQTDVLRIVKAKHDTFLNKVHQLPESLPKIDFAAYKSRLPDPTMADRFQKAYEALSIPYPVDKENVLQKVEAEKDRLEKEAREIIAVLDKNLQFNRTFLAKMDTLPKITELTCEAYTYYFPQRSLLEIFQEKQKKIEAIQAGGDHH